MSCDVTGNEAFASSKKVVSFDSYSFFLSGLEGLTGNFGVEKYGTREEKAHEKEDRLLF